jgi:MFS family permease
MLVAFRLLQGLLGGPMVTLSQSLLLSNYPPDKKHIAMAIWGMSIILAPVCGPILGGFIVPLSFKYGSHGSDVHYCGTLPMKKIPSIGQTNEYGEVFGMHGVSAIDGASLPLLSEKSHTLTIMANADRIGRKVAKELCGKN